MGETEADGWFNETDGGSVQSCDSKREVGARGDERSYYFPTVVNQAMFEIDDAPVPGARGGFRDSRGRKGGRRRCENFKHHKVAPRPVGEACRWLR